MSSKKSEVKSEVVAWSMKKICIRLARARRYVMADGDRDVLLAILGAALMTAAETRHAAESGDDDLVEVGLRLLADLHLPSTDPRVVGLLAAVRHTAMMCRWRDPLTRVCTL